METSSIVKEYLKKTHAAVACRTEQVYIFQAPLVGESRISSCEVIIRQQGEDLVLTAVLPVSVKIKEARGVSRWLANLNDSRKKPGFFELDNLAGRIQFRVKMNGPLTEEQLEVGVHYCLEQVEADSDQLVKLVCDESRAVHEAELEAIRKRQAAQKGASPVQNALNKVMGMIGIMPDAEPVPEAEPEETPEEDRLTFKAAALPEAEEEKLKAIEAPETEEPDAESEPEQAEAEETQPE